MGSFSMAKLILLIISAIKLAYSAPSPPLNETALAGPEKTHPEVGRPSNEVIIKGGNSLLKFSAYHQPSAQYYDVVTFLRELDEYITFIISRIPSARPETEWPGRSLIFVSASNLRVDLKPEEHEPPYPFTLMHVTQFLDDLNEWIASGVWRMGLRIPSQELTYAVFDSPAEAELVSLAKGSLQFGLESAGTSVERRALGGVVR